MGRKEKTKYKILYIGNFADISVGEPEIAKSLEEQGHEVDRVEERSPITTIAKLNQLIRDNGYDFILFAKFRVDNPIDRRLFIKHCPIPTVMWGFDLYYGL